MLCVMPLHLPGYNYLGPGTYDFSQKPVNEADKVAREHDLAYANAKSDEDIRKADRESIPKFLTSGSVGGVVGAAGIGIKYGVESVTGVLYGNNSMSNKRPAESEGDAPQKVHRSNSESDISEISSLGIGSVNSDQYMDIDSEHYLPHNPEGGMSASSLAPGTDGGNVIGAGHNPAQSLKFTKKFQIYSGAFQFHNRDVNADWKSQYVEPSTDPTKVTELSTPLCTIDPNQLMWFLSEQEYKNLPLYSFAKSCKIRITPLGYRLPFETNSSSAGFANSQVIVQCCKAIGLNHKFEGYTSGYSSDATDPTKPTGNLNTLSLRGTLYGQSSVITNIGCNVGIPRHINWYYNIWNLGRIYDDSTTGTYGGTPNLLKAMEIMNVNDVRGQPIIDFTYKYKCAPLRMGISSTTETYMYQAGGSRRTTFKAWKPHQTISNEKDVSNVVIDGQPIEGGSEAVWQPEYTTIVEKAAFLVVDPTHGRQSDVTPPLVHFGCMPIQSNPPLISPATFASGAIQWEVHTEMDIEFLTDSPYPHLMGPWQIQYDPVTMRGLRGENDQALHSNTSKAFNRGRHIYSRYSTPYSTQATFGVITNKTPIAYPGGPVNSFANDHRIVIRDVPETDDEILAHSKINKSLLTEDEVQELVWDYKRSSERIKARNKKLNEKAEKRGNNPNEVKKRRINPTTLETSTDTSKKPESTISGGTTRR